MREGEYDAVIVGARVAGSVLTALLGDAGRRVLLVDAASFPSPTISTHFFRGAWMLTALKRLGVLEDVLALGSPRLVSTYWYGEGATEAAVGPAQEPGEIGYCLSVRREPLDHIF